MYEGAGKDCWEGLECSELSSQVYSGRKGGLVVCIFLIIKMIINQIIIGFRFDSNQMKKMKDLKKLKDFLIHTINWLIISKQ